jgi:predicted RNA-binding Zn-ribbon protein involved in translation (DUF1610 family)
MLLLSQILYNTKTETNERERFLQYYSENGADVFTICGHGRGKTEVYFDCPLCGDETLMLVFGERYIYNCDRQIIGDDLPPVLICWECMRALKMKDPEITAQYYKALGIDPFETENAK